MGPLTRGLDPSRRVIALNRVLGDFAELADDLFRPTRRFKMSDLSREVKRG